MLIRTLSAQRAAHEGNIADFLADSHFHGVLQMRFGRRGDIFVDSVEKLLQLVVVSRGDRSM